MIEKWLERTNLLIGDEKELILKNSKILIVGCGGVGGYVCEFLVRAGVYNITIVDDDCVELSNLNRQIIALSSTIGKSKVCVLKERMLDINPKSIIDDKRIKLTEQSIVFIFDKKYDYVVDCIDDTQNKLVLIKYCYENNIKCISALGTGNRTEITQYEVADIFKTSYDPLAKKMRKLLNDAGVKSHLVVYSKSVGTKNFSGVISSISYLPPCCACVLSQFVLKSIMENKV